MIDCILEALEKVNTGVIITDCNQEIVFWNNEITKISNVPKETAVGKKLYEVCPKFAERRYQDIIENLFVTGQSRFCSGVLHKYFIVPEDSKNPDLFRQNLKVDPIKISDKINYALLQLNDISENFQNELKLKQLIEELKRGYSAIKDSEIAAQKKANYDSLTGILNRNGLEFELQKAIQNADSKKCKLAAFFLDLDGFKYVNDTYGHMIGDVLLQQVAGRLKGYIRLRGQRTQDVFARLGGDEFIIILQNADKDADLIVVADRIIKSIRKPFFVDNHTIHITLSLGIAIYPDDANSVEELIRKADQTMYRIKQSGKDRFGFLRDNLF
jgi:diguanylate cyclase